MRTYLGVIDIVHLVKDDELDISNQVGALVQHTPKNFGRHLWRSHECSLICEAPFTYDQARPFWVDLHVSCQDAHVRGLEGRLEVAELLV